MNDATLIVQELIAGNKRFTEGKTIHSNDQSLKKLKAFAESGQVPKAIVLCCSDSRAPVEIIFDQDIGDLFVIRVAGNIVAPSLVGSIEFAASTFGTSVVLVMGHSQCGAIKATLNHIANPQTIYSENIHDLVGRIRPHIFMLAQRKDILEEERMNLAVEANVRASVSHLTHASRLIENLVLENKLTIVGATLDLTNGEVRFLEL
jgi:carbonic anhydrase